MDQRIATLIVAEDFVETVRNRVEDHYLVWFSRKVLRTCKSKLEGHVETGRVSDTTEVMDRHPTRPQETENARQTTLSLLLNFEYAPRLLAEAHQGAQQRDEKRLVAGIVGRV